MIRVLLSASFSLQLWPSSLFTGRPESWDRAPLQQERFHHPTPAKHEVVTLGERALDARHVVAEGHCTHGDDPSPVGAVFLPL